MTLIERIKNAYSKLNILPDRKDCYQPMSVLFKAEYGFEASVDTLQIFMFDKVFNRSYDMLEGFLIGFGTDIHFPPKNTADFSTGFREGRDLVIQMAS
jgi:hypothetical protein